jgi:integrase
MIHIDLTNKRGSAKDKAMSEDEYLILKDKLDKIKQQRERVILFLGARAGLRVSEIIQCRLKWLSVKKIGSKEVLEINIPNEDQDIKNLKSKWYVKNTAKTKKNKQRTTYLFNPDEYHEVLNFFMYNQKGVNYTRQHINTEIVKKKFSNLIDRKQDNQLTAHSLRATAQNYLYYVKNLDSKFIAVILGHEDIRTTLQHYNSMNKASAESYLIGIINNTKEF